MAGIIRDRGCLYYVPWIPVFCLMMLGGGIGVWIHFGIQTYHDTNDAMNTLGVKAYNIERPRPAIIATAVFVLFTIVMITALSFARSFIEAAHDATGLAGPGSVVWMVLVVIVSICWWIIVLWNVLLIMGGTVWSACLYILRESINTLLDRYGPQPPVSWLPSSNLPCPGECLNLTLYTFINSDLANSCICDYAKLSVARDELYSGYKDSAAMYAGIWLMFIGSLCLLVNFACQFAHTSREREYIRRLTYKQFIGI